MNSDIRQLCLDTLHYLQRVPGNSCIVANTFGVTLGQLGAEAIPVIEEVIRDVVAPALESHYAEHGAPDLDAIISEGPPFSGLTDLFGAYWIICARTNAGRAIEFFKTMPLSVLCEAVSCMAPFFNRKHPICEIALPEEYKEYLNALSHSGIPEYEDVASHVAGRIGCRSAE